MHPMSTGNLFPLRLGVCCSEAGVVFRYSVSVTHTHTHTDTVPVSKKLVCFSLLNIVSNTASDVDYHFGHHFDRHFYFSVRVFLERCVYSVSLCVFAKSNMYPSVFPYTISYSSCIETHF